MVSKLPQYKTPEYTTTLPLSQKKIAYRPYNVGDERILVAAVAARDTDPDFYIQNTLKVIQGVIITDINIDTQAAIDVRHLLISMRAKSAGEVIEFKYKGKKVEVNIADFYVLGQREPDAYKIDVGQGFGLKMKDLSFGDEIRASAAIEKGNARVDTFFKIMIKSVESIYTADEAYVVGSDISYEEAENFIQSIPGEQSRKIYEFIQSMPSIAVDMIVDGEKVTITDKEVDFLSSAQDT